MDGGPNIRALLHRRREELIKLRARVRAHLQQIDDELESIEKAAAAISFDFETAINQTEENAEKLKRPIPGMTMKEASIEILEKHPGGCTATEIRFLMRDMFGMNFERSSLSPQLSRLKFDGVVTRRDGRWVLPKFVSENRNELFPGAEEKEKAPEANAPGASRMA